MDDGSNLLAILLAAAVLGLIPAFIARSRGASFLGWWFFGFLLFIVALPASFFVKRDREALDVRRMARDGLKKCPQCAEMIRDDALVCRYCQAPQATVEAAAAPSNRTCPRCGTPAPVDAQYCGSCRRALATA